jgi:cytochrome c6
MQRCELHKSEEKVKMRIIAALFLTLTLAGVAAAEDSGKSLFASKCALCHGADGTGKTAVGKNLKIPDLHSADVQKQSDADLKAIVTNGKNKMPPFKGKLTAAQIDQALAYVRDLGK